MSYDNSNQVTLGQGPDGGIINPPGFAEYVPPRRPAVMDSSESGKMTPQILLLLVVTGLRRCWKWALPTGLVLGAATATVLWCVFPIKYEAIAWLQISYSKPYFVYDEKLAVQQYDKLVNTQFAILRSPIILNKALENPEVRRLPEILKQKDPVGWLSKKMSLSSQSNSELITVAFEMEDPRAAQLVVKSIVSAFVNYNNDELTNWNVKLINQLNLEMNRKHQEAQLLQTEIRNKTKEASKVGASSAAEGKGVKLEETLQKDVYLAEARFDELTAAYETLKTYRDSQIDVPKEIVQNAIQNDPQLQRLLAEQRDLDELREQYTIKISSEQALERFDAQRNTLTMRINEYMKKLREEKPIELAQVMKQNLDSSLWEKELAVKAQKALVDKLREKLNQQKSDQAAGAAEVVDVGFSQDQLMRVNTVLDLLNTRIVALKTEQNAPNRVQLKAEPALPMQSKTQKRLPFAAIGGLACFLFPFGLGVALERTRPRLYHVSQIRSAIPNVIIGEIMEPPVAWVHGTTFRKRLARYRESVHSWCTHLLLSHPFNQCRTLAVASVAGDDGKTFLAIQVAVAMAQMKSGPVLLIDGDMRVGRLHLLFGNEEPGIGLADVLSFRKGIGEAVVLNEKEPNLHLLSAGNLDVSPYELLGDGRFRELLDTLENHYALIMVVLPPVANAAESLVMAQSVDSVLLCIRQGETLLGAMEDVFRKLVNTGSNVDGIVVKDVPYYQMSGKDGGFADKVEQVRLSHLLQYSD